MQGATIGGVPGCRNSHEWLILGALDKTDFPQRKHYLADALAATHGKTVRWQKRTSRG